MKIQDESVSLSESADLNEDRKVNDYLLPAGYSSKAAYVLEEAVFGTEKSTIGEDLDVSEEKVGEVIEEMSDNGLLKESNEGDNSYALKNKGKQVIEHYHDALYSEVVMVNSDSRDSGFGEEIVFGDGKYDTRQEIQVLLSTIHEEYSQSDLEQDTEMSILDISNIKDDIDPLLEADDSSYNPNYNLTDLGKHVLTHLMHTTLHETGEQNIEKLLSNSKNT